ncbi:ANTAR domain-containing protein [Propionicimonas sp.]|uniref:ANTAR domain-containing protein n=1 Tax=Propionicimonas sp. TaxID=1955623 RepID=UPI0039E6289E
MNSGTSADEHLAATDPLGPWLSALSRLGSVGTSIATTQGSVGLLGPVEEWPEELRAAVSSCLASELPLAVVWGATSSGVVCNEAWIRASGRIAPAPGASVHTVMPELVPAVEGVLAGRPEGRFGMVGRAGRGPFDVWLTPIADADAVVRGVLAIGAGGVDSGLAGRRIAVLLDLWTTTRNCTDPGQVRETAATLIESRVPEFRSAAVVDDSDPTTWAGEVGRLCAPVPTEPPSAPSTPQLVVQVEDAASADPSLSDYATALAAVLGAALDRAAARLQQGDSERASDALWRQAVLHSFRDAIMMFDAEGRVVELNQAFTDLFGFSLAEDGPISPPYPWWPTMKEDPERHAEAWSLLRQTMDDQDVDAELLFYTRDRRPVWVHSTGSSITHPVSGTTARIRVLRDITRAREARARRATAAEVCAAFGQFDDLGSLLGCAEHAFAVLFDGGSTIQVEVGERYLFGEGRRLRAQDLTQEVEVGLAGSPNPDTASLRPGILLVPGSTSAGARAWVQFPRPRRISADEMVAADLLAHAFGLAVDRLVDAQRAADRTANLEYAVESHRMIGQAVGILVERHRLTPAKAFDLLRAASQTRNLKLREVAQRVIETGVDPDSA